MHVAASCPKRILPTMVIGLVLSMSAANLNPDECGALIAFQEQELDAQRRGVQQQRSLTVVAMKKMQHMTKVAESFNAANLGCSVAFWSEVSHPTCFCSHL